MDTKDNHYKARIAQPVPPVSLPPVSILEKIKTRDAQGPAWIIDRMKDIQDEEHARQSLNKGIERRKNARTAFLKGLASVFGLTARDPFPETDPATEVRNSIAHSWTTVGDYIRMAMRDYMNENGLTAEDLGLTPEEQQALNLILVRNDAYPASDL